MTNLGYNLSSGAVAIFGIFGMKDSQFAPNTFFFYVPGIIVMCLLAGLGGEMLQDMVHRLWVYKKSKSKKNGMGLGNRYV